ncbi:MAG TPA: NAD-dependent deacylase [Isosphaeraceae bacterium]|nr:NAD-dependent deacylase [Isosphaeraceae bacterium]
MTDLGRAASLLAQARRIAVLTGAGVSAESGIPTFRGLEGLWRGRDPMRLATPQAFAADPALVWEFYNWRRDLVARAEPNAAHLTLVELAGRTPHFVLITQNVDRLHQRAGSRDVIELHGNLFDVRCTGCGTTLDRTGVALPSPPRCDDCGALLRPGVVWFGEPLPPDAWHAAESAVRAADLLLVVGTSAVVYPAAGLIGSARRAGLAIIEINLEPTPVSDAIDLGLYGPAGIILPKIVPAPAD